MVALSSRGVWCVLMDVDTRMIKLAILSEEGEKNGIND